MALNQQYDGLEHTPSGTTLKTSIHGKLEYFISITATTAKVSYPEVKVGGSAYAVAHGMPSGDLPELTVMIRKSGLKPFEDQIRTQGGYGENDRLELAGVRMLLSLVSAPFDDQFEDALPTAVREIPVIYCGHDSGSDRKSNDALECSLFFKQTAPASEK